MRTNLLIKEARRRAGITQTELARRLGTSQSVIARWESGRDEPSYRNLRRAVQACGFQIDIRLRPRDEHDSGLIAINLSMSPDQRLENLEGMIRFAAEASGAKKLS